MTTPAAIAEWVRHQADQFKQLLPWKRTSFQCASTDSNVLRTLDAQQMTQVLTRAEARGRWGEEPSRLGGDAQRDDEWETRCVTHVVRAKTLR